MLGKENLLEENIYQGKIDGVESLRMFCTRKLLYCVGSKNLMERISPISV